MSIDATAFGDALRRALATDVPPTPPIRLQSLVAGWAEARDREELAQHNWTIQGL